MDYIQITLGGSLKGLKFNQLTYITFYKFIDLLNFDATFHYAAVYAGLLSNAYVKREDFADEFETVCQWVDELSTDDRNKIVEAFNSTAYWQNIVKEGKAEKTVAQKKRKTKSTLKNV